MLIDVLENREDYKRVKESARVLSIKNEFNYYVSYVARADKFKISDWYDDSTIGYFNNGDWSDF